MVKQGLPAVTRYQPQTDKIMRMHAQTAMIESGFVQLPKEARWLAEYLQELTAFAKGKRHKMSGLAQAGRPRAGGDLSVL